MPWITRSFIIIHNMTEGVRGTRKVMEKQGKVAQYVSMKQYYVNQKYDLEEALTPLYGWKQEYFNWCKRQKREDYSLTFLLDQIRASYLSPAYNYNKLVDEIIQDMFWDEIKYEIPDCQWVSMGRRTSQIIIELQNCLVSIKIALDRSVKLFRLYKKGIAEYSTFGHIDSSTNKAKGFMAQVIQDKDKDDILEYVYQKYCEWIRECVQPRDAIIHYDDIQVEYFFFEGHEIPKFICRKKQDVIEFSFQDVTLYISSFYAFYSDVTRMIFEKITNFAE